MGYYTSYELDVITSAPGLTEDRVSKMKAEIDKMNVFEGSYYIDQEETLLEYYYHGTWYDHNKDMTILSSRFPEFLFCLSGCGETYGDIWKCYFKDGKRQFCPAKIVYPEYDPLKLEREILDITDKDKYSYA